MQNGWHAGVLTIASAIRKMEHMKRRMRQQRQMSVDERVLHEAAQDIFTSLCPLNDLGPELSKMVGLTDDSSSESIGLSSDSVR
jgi:hypothetical protein